jgi:glycosyltransferase involved in cell wall biosynthesis/SAM-dependent methyltransferase
MNSTDAATSIGERQKWDDYYAALPMVEIDDATRAFGEDLATRIGELLPPDGRVLEAGCGAGWQSLVLAQAGKQRLTLMDFSAEALNYAKRAFAKHDLAADFVCQDVFAPGAPEYDLVFNAGVLEHYDFDQQVAFLRGMASRSRRYVIALVPNRQCYWYWMWRLHRSSRGGWPFGKEMPMADMSAAFEAAGLRFLGHWHGGEKWSEFYITDLDGMDDRLRDELLAIHRSPVIPKENRAYLVAALGCKDETTGVPACWTRGAASNEFAIDRLTAAMADATAATVAAEHRRKQVETAMAEAERRWRRELADEKDAAAALADELESVKRTRSYRVMQSLERVRLALAPRGTLRDKTLKAGWKSLHGDFAYLRRLSPAATCRSAAQRAGLWLVPCGSLRERCLRKASHKAHRARCRVVSQPGMDLAEVLRQTEGRKGIVIYPPFIDWNWMRQRPHQLMAQFAAAGYLSLFCSPKVRSDMFRGFKRLDERLYLCDSLDSLCDLPNPVLLTSWTGHWQTIKRFRSPLVIYDYLDDLSVSSKDGVPDERKLELHRKLATRSEIVLATARRLYEEMRGLRRDVLYCPNGADYDHFHLTSPLPAPSDMAEVVESGKPIIGYYGALARWFDYALLAEAARVYHNFEFVLIGPNFDRTLMRQPLAKLPNVHWLGQKPYEELPAYLHYFSAATIPFVINDITKATSPVKLFEYMAGGKPIVTTDMPECREYPCVMVARNAPEYVAMLDEAVCRGSWESHRQALDREAKSNTWDVRARQILDQVERIITQTKLQSA